MESNKEFRIEDLPILNGPAEEAEYAAFLASPEGQAQMARRAAAEARREKQWAEDAIIREEGDRRFRRLVGLE